MIRSNTRRRRRHLLLAASLVLAACGGGDGAGTASDSSGDEAPAGDPVDGGTLRVVWAVDVSLFDPATSGSGLGRGMMSPVLQGLTQLDPETGEVQPLLATSWDVSDDGLAWTFELRDDVTFQDGTPFNADTVVANVERWLDPDFNHVTRSRLEAIANVRAEAEHTVVFELSRPYPPLPNTMGEGFHYMLSQADIEEHYLDLGQHLPAGTGPFRVTEFAPGQSIVMERWEDYAGDEEVNLDRIEVETVADNSARTARLLAGEADLNLYQSGLDIARVESNPDLEIVTTDSLRQWHFYINANQPHLSDVRVRQALAHAVDQEALVQVPLQGFGTPRYSLVPAAHIGGKEVDEPLEYDPDRALELFAEAGWTQDDAGKLRNEDGDQFTLRLDHTTGGVYVGDTAISDAVAGFWRELGIEVEAVAMDRATFYGTVTEDPASVERNEVVAIPFSIEYQDGAAFLDLSYTERSLPPDSCCNFGVYSNPDGWAAIDAALAATGDERVQLIEEAQDVLWADVPAVPGPQLELIAAKVADLEVTLASNDLHPLALAYFTDGG